MSLFQELKNKQLQARKDQNVEVRDTLTLIIGECQRTIVKQSEPITDSVVTKVLKKLIESLSSNIEDLKTRNLDYSVQLNEMNYIGTLIPIEEPKLPLEVITSIVSQYIVENSLTGANSLGKVMGYAKTIPHMDLQLANQVARKILCA